MLKPVTVLAFVLAAAPACASPVTLQEALSQFLATSPHVRASQEQVQQAEAQVMATGFLPNPTLGYTREQILGASLPGSENAFMLQMTLPVTQRRQLALSAAEAELTAARSRRAETILALRRGFQASFLQACREQERQTVLAETVGTYQALEKIVKARVDAQESAGYDLLRLRLTLGHLHSQLEQARNSAKVAQSQLAGLLGGTLAGEWQLPDLPPLPPLSELQAQALRQRSDLATLAAEEAIARIAMQQAEWQRWPDPQLEAGLRHAEQGGQGGLGYQAGLSWPLPLFNQGQADQSMAQARLRALTERQQSIRQQIESQLPLHRQALQDMHQALADFRRGPLVSLPQLLAVAQLSYQEGETDIVDLLDAQQAALDGRLQYLELLAQTHQNWLKLEELAGVFLLVPEGSPLERS